MAPIGTPVDLDTGEPVGEDLEVVSGSGLPPSVRPAPRPLKKGNVGLTAAAPIKPPANIAPLPTRVNLPPKVQSGGALPGNPAKEILETVTAAPRPRATRPARTPKAPSALPPAAAQLIAPEAAQELAAVMPGAEVAEPPMVEQSPNPKVCILLPWYKTSNPLTATSVAALLKRQNTSWSVDFGDAFIAHSRNKLADKFLSKNVEWSVWVDDDMIVPFGDEAWLNHYCGFTRRIPGVNCIDKLVAHNKTLVGALYRGRYPGGKWMFGEASAQPKLNLEISRGQHKGLRPTAWVATGCLLIHRQVFLDIEQKFPHLARKADGTGGNWFSSSEHDLVDGVQRVMQVIEDASVDESTKIVEIRRIMMRARQASEQNSKLGTGEDVIFCHRARQAGHTAHVDLDCVAGHYGNHVFGFDPTCKTGQ